MFKFISVLFVLLLSSCSFYESPRYTSYNQRGKYHYIRSGDTLWKISKKYRIDIEQLAVLNGIKNPNRLKVGKRIFIPRRSFRQLYAPGKVIYSSWGPGSYGKMIIVRHVGGRFHSVYANNSKNLVKLHQNVLAGTPIARAGNSRYKGKSTLRFEIRYRTVPKNPLSYLPKAY
jgi:murein DD-endopeptidase MepM/ murein hydrolase activator NlpD